MSKEKTPNHTCPIDYYGIPDCGKLTEWDREHLEQKLSRLLECVGAWVPDRIMLDGNELPLHDIIWNIVNKRVISDSERDLLLSLEQKLSKKFNDDVERIKHSDSMEGQAIDDYCEALGLLRAIISLKDITTREAKTESKDELVNKMRESTKNHAKYWLDFLKQLQ